MKRIYFNNTKTGLKSLLTGMFLLGAFFAEAQCTSSFNYTVGANNVVNFESTSSGTTISTAYLWSFGGSSPVNMGPTTLYQFSSSGSQVVCLTMVSNTTIPNSCSVTTCYTIALTTTTSCNANFNYSLGANGSVIFSSTSTGTTGSTAYSWNFGGTSSTAAHTFTANGPYQVCLSINSNTTLPNQCTSTKCDTVWITNITPSTTPCNANFTSVLGANGSANFASTSTGTIAGTMYNWSFGDGSNGTGLTPAHTYTSNGNKIVCLTITNSVSAFCTSTKCDTIAITNISGSVTPCTPTVMYTLSKDTTLALTWYAYPAYPSNISNATWTWGDGSTTTGLYPSHTYSAAGTYSTCVTVSVSCGTITATYCYVAGIFRSSETNDMITVNIKQATPTGIKNESKLENLLNVYPNPNNGEFVLEFANNGKELKENTVMIYNIMGEKVFEKHLLSNSNQTIDVSNLADGTYFVNVSSELGSFNKKIIIQK